ncbi:phasin family protein [Mesorhizobium sp. M1A.F.Ca.IN.020.06.1.1]|uniref:phasin family protein n=1 Tax=unclassified Mesorhizobium TaxID=325217 RepID=UPI000BAEF063|nr:MULTISPECIES: TIGR01841 family phasin [unclassified Mesorhizobium]PBB30116.1 phasin family protein [Mesorhizobium sp. WSM3882]RUV05519.1 phasin family protein [Mesorhizobium sp. M1A.F.Ca.IN.020.03.2.1]RUV83908.1 phasin family protein [Mesorhizobium sp. M1A.F.Ca.IN.020.32.1.1]RUW13999.1 phasin family protein [Mesorhizobium sp. M1A.F.Ca.IN.022.05.2.1]RUW21281.1 phasin family protein [Mesorhizobium sp. M1A.F.Ca.IN.020.06.1.1]
MASQPESDSFLDIFSRFGRDLKLPKVDIQAILDHHRRNLEALEKSARASAAGASSILSRQHEMVQEALGEITRMARNYQPPGNPQELMTKQVDFARKSFETTLKNAGEVADLVRKSGTESVEILRDRIKDAMAEIRAGYDGK